MERDNPAARKQFLNLAAQSLNQALALDSENLTAHYLLGLIYAQLGDETKAAYHRQEHRKYLPDYNAQDQAISVARRADAAADHAAQATVIYSLQRPGAPGLNSTPTTASATR